MEFLQDSNWIWSDPWEGEDREVPRIVYFRKQIELDGRAESATINISADSRYKLYINGKLVEVGPEKGDAQIWFYDTVDLASYLVRAFRFPGLTEPGTSRRIYGFAAFQSDASYPGRIHPAVSGFPSAFS